MKWYLLALACGAVIGVRVEIRRRRIAEADAKFFAVNIPQQRPTPAKGFEKLTPDEYERVLRDAARRRGETVLLKPLKAQKVDPPIDKVRRFNQRMGRA